MTINKNISLNSKITEKLAKHLTSEEIGFVSNQILPKNCTKFKLIYRLSSNNGFSAKKFHKNCDKHSKTIFICESDNGKKFGGLNFLNWGIDSIDKKTTKNLIFSIDKRSIHPIEINTGDEDEEDKGSGNAILYDKQKGPMMGEGDLVIGDQCHEVRSCSSRFRTYAYEEEEDPEKYLTGSASFSLKSFYIYKFE